MTYDLSPAKLADIKETAILTSLVSDKEIITFTLFLEFSVALFIKKLKNVHMFWPSDSTQPEMYFKEVIKVMQRFSYKNVVYTSKIWKWPKCQSMGSLLNTR